MYRKKIILSLVLASTLVLLGSQKYRVHTVKKNETLYSIARNYQVSVQEIASINALSGEIIKPGQIIRIPIPGGNEYIVKTNDTLEGISRSFGTDAETLKRLNHLKSDIIKPGMTLRLPRTAGSNEVYTVENGDNLTIISLLYGISLDSLKSENGISESSPLIPGQKLKIPVLNRYVIAKTDPVITAHESQYRVKSGDTLWSLSRRWGVSVEDVIQENNLSKEILFDGQLLIIPKKKPLPPPNNSLLGYYNQLPAKGRIIHATGDYFHFSPRKGTQSSEKYGEEFHRNPLDNYRKGKTILQAFDKSVKGMNRISHILDGYTIVLDPGHGGNDPGFVVGSTNKKGETVYLVEDEYNYDIALRVYRLLVLNGADVRLTLLSPNHHIRSTTDPSLTYVNEKNEVYNSETQNSQQAQSCFPDGNPWGLVRRKQVARELFSGVPVNKRLFVSIHSDNNPGLSRAPYIIFDGNSTKETAANKTFAEMVAAGMGNGTEFGTQSILVLKDNPAKAAILIEVRNIYYPDNAWAIRKDESREKDAVQIVSGIIHYVKSVK